MNKVILHDELTALYLPATLEGDHRLLPAFTCDDDWHNISPILDLNVWEDGGEIHAALYLCSNGVTLTDDFVSLQVEDKRTKPEPESVEQTIERLLNTIEDVRRIAQRAIDIIKQSETPLVRSTIVEEALNKIIEKHQQSY